MEVTLKEAETTLDPKDNYHNKSEEINKNNLFPEKVLNSKIHRLKDQKLTE